MIDFDRVVPTICLVVMFGLIPKSAVSITDELCKVRFPDGFYCNSACEQWHVLSARYLALGVWRFFYVDTESDMESICERTITGEKFYTNNTDNVCSPFKDRSRRYKRHTPANHSAKRQNTNKDLGSPLKRSGYVGKIPVDAICLIATGKVCRQNGMIHCPSAEECCYAQIYPEVCDEIILSEYNECYKVLDSVLNELLL